MCDTSVGKGSARKSLHVLAKLTGVSFGEGKGQEMTHKFVYTGCRVSMEDAFGGGTITVDCKPGRREALQAEAFDALRAGWLDPGRAGTLRAKAHFASTTLAGRCLRGCENALGAVQHGKFPAQLIEASRMALEYIIRATMLLPPVW